MEEEASVTDVASSVVESETLDKRETLEDHGLIDQEFKCETDGTKRFFIDDEVDEQNITRLPQV